MPHDRWSDCNETLNALCIAIQHGTYGRVQNLSLELATERCVVVCADCCGYYGAQLLIQTVWRFADEHRTFGGTRLLLSVRGRRLEISITRPSSVVSSQPVSTHVVDRHLQLSPAGFPAA